MLECTPITTIPFLYWLHSPATAKVVADLCIEFAAAGYISSLLSIHEPITLIRSLILAIVTTLVAIGIESSLHPSNGSE